MSIENKIKFPESVTGKELAEFLGVEYRRLRYFAEQGMPKKRYARFDPEECLRWYIKHLREAAASSDQLKASQIRMNNARADMTELDVAMKKKDLMPTEDVSAMITKILSTLKIQMLTMSSSITYELASEEKPAVIKKIIDDKAREVLISAAEKLEKLSKKKTRMRK